MTKRALLSLGCGAILASLAATTTAAEAVASNESELPIHQVVTVTGTGDRVDVSGTIAIRADVSPAASGVTLEVACQSRGGGTATSGGGRWVLVSSEERQSVAVPTALPADSVLACPAVLAADGSPVIQPIRLRVRATVHEDGRATFLLEGVEGG